jgi:hypothetical protein
MKGGNVAQFLDVSPVFMEFCVPTQERGNEIMLGFFIALAPFWERKGSLHFAQFSDEGFEDDS